MTRFLSCLGLTCIVAGACAPPAAAELIERSGRFGGMPVTYKMINLSPRLFDQIESCR